MTQPFLGQIQPFGFGFAPRGWALCNGQLLSISQNTALFSLLGTMYGGNGITTFALPNLQSRVGMSAGTDPVGNNYSPGRGSRRGDDHPQSQHHAASHPHVFRHHRHRRHARSRADDVGARQLSESRSAAPAIRITRAPGALQPLNPASVGILRRQPAAHQSATLPDDQLVHRHAGHIPGAQLTAANTPKNREGLIDDERVPRTDHDVRRQLQPARLRLLQRANAADRAEPGAVLAARGRPMAATAPPPSHCPICNRGCRCTRARAPACRATRSGKTAAYPP